MLGGDTRDSKIMTLFPAGVTKLHVTTPHRFETLVFDVFVLTVLGEWSFKMQYFKEEKNLGKKISVSYHLSYSLINISLCC